ncbi:MAG: hypothetical protein QOD92_642 [Acidimicrobiaceae bacterium]|jgi:anionic cell wall polymer biosynthesis LytR-Cps2A-Psr (LCP) family protein
MVILASAIPVLGYVGFQKVFNTTQGRRVDAQNDPGRPNYEANVTPTPVLLLAQTNSDGVTGLSMLSLGGGDAGGGVVFIPVNTVTEQLPTSASSTTTSTTSSSRTTTTEPPSVKTTTLAAAYADQGAADLNQLTANVVGVSFDELVVMSDEQLAAFIAPVAPLTINNPDRLVALDSAGRTQVVFAAGDLKLEAADVTRYLAIRNPQESDLNRLARHQLVWQAWLAAVRGSVNPNAVPGETSSGLGRYVRGLAKGNTQFAALPVTPQSSNGTETFAPDANRVAALVSSFVKLPTPARPGDRVRVRLLSGVGPVNVDQLLSSSLVTARSQITIVGNADRFDYATTEIVYYDDAFANAAAELQQLFGVGQATKSTTPTDSEDVTVIIGKDLVDKRGLQITTGSGGG